MNKSKNISSKSKKRKHEVDSCGSENQHRKATPVPVQQRLDDSDDEFECPSDVSDEEEEGFEINIGEHWSSSNNPTDLTFESVTPRSKLPHVSITDMLNYSVMAKSEDLLLSKKMYDSNCLLECSYAKEPNENTFFLTAVCCSEVNRHKLFNVQLKIKNDIIVQGKCECDIGEGPYAQCKHILVLLYGLIEFSLNKKINTQVTEQSSDPMRAENLKILVKKNIFIDPRPNKFRNDPNYEDQFKQVVLNYISKHNTDMPIVQLVRPVKTELKSYISSVSGENKRQYPKATCDYCKKEMLKKHLLNHIRVRHLKIKKFKCNECNRAFGTPYELVHHVRCYRKL